jgi:hypothetical protein
MKPTISPEAREAFLALISGDPSFGLAPCYVNGEEATAVVRLTSLPNNRTQVDCLFVTVTPGMKIFDDRGIRATETEG